MSVIGKVIQRRFSPRIEYIKGDSIERSNSYEVELRGLKINGTEKSLPNLIFFVDWFDKAENWISFFTQKR
jgi:hypothetical protein